MALTKNTQGKHAVVVSRLRVYDNVKFVINTMVSWGTYCYCKVCCNKNDY